MEGVNNSCLMLACALYAPVDLSSIFDEEDLMGNGIELESHITLIYTQDKIIPKDEVIEQIKNSLSTSELNELMNILEEDEVIGENIFDDFELDVFKNDSDFLILKLKESSKLYSSITRINETFKDKYGIPSKFTYTPHITLAELNSGLGDKYINSKKLKLILNHSTISVEDLIISYGVSNEKLDRFKFNLTTFHAVARYFRERELKKSSEL